jgi:hypothetical protein
MALPFGVLAGRQVKAIQSGLQPVNDSSESKAQSEHDEKSAAKFAVIDREVCFHRSVGV